MVCAGCGGPGSDEVGEATELQIRGGEGESDDNVYAVLG